MWFNQNHSTRTILVSQLEQGIWHLVAEHFEQIECVRNLNFRPACSSLSLQNTLYSESSGVRRQAHPNAHPIWIHVMFVSIFKFMFTTSSSSRPLFNVLIWKLWFIRLVNLPEPVSAEAPLTDRRPNILPEMSSSPMHWILRTREYLLNTH